MQTILIIDDDQQLLLLLSAYLKNIGYGVMTARNGKEGFELIQKNKKEIDLAIIDISMPIIDGIELCQLIRNKLNLKSLPLIILTSLDGLDDKYLCFNSGANDYLVKPFEPLELDLRIRSLFNLLSASNPEKNDSALLNDQNIQINKSNYTVTIQDKKVYLTPTEFELFKFFYDHPNEFLLPELILEKVFCYPSGTGGSENLRTHIRNLRLKLEPDPTKPKIIVNLLKRGYCLNTNFNNS